MTNWSAKHNGVKVVMALHNSFPHTGAGYAVRSQSIARNLTAQGVDLDVYTRPGFPWNLDSDDETTIALKDSVEGVTYNRLPLKAPDLGSNGIPYMQSSSGQWLSLFQKLKNRIVHSASSFHTGMPVAIAAQKAGIKSVYEYRGMWHYSLQSRVPWYIDAEDYELRHKYEIETGAKSDAVFSISEALREELVSYGIERKKITVLPNAVDTEIFKPLLPDESLKNSLGLDGRKVVGFIGSLTNYEGLNYLMDAVLELNYRGEKVSLLIVGDGKEKPFMEKLHKARGNHPSIIFTGKVPFEEVGRYYSIVDVLPFPRINAKVCNCVPPLKPMEAMAMGKPVIVSNVDALCEMVQDEETGLICKADDIKSLTEQLGRILTDESLSNRLVQNATQWIHEERTWEVNCKRILQVYESLIG
ncbi:glycosyltransferase family 4 protein [Maridesulfovibrio sp.]|uniref:glycosyltransferase family 4 protein n=1 Tax=Maridesulfovibrio sp. TaxID=2795000 RepID=UPI0029F46820|nr:glycosyltransferase family 4 protein [Maridesulfovibrio sp.]